MGELLGKYRSLRVYMDACVHCGACSDKCHYFLGTEDPKNMPCLLYTSDAADERSSVDLGGRRIITKQKKIEKKDTQRNFNRHT